jgi:hypothetical protein
MLRRASRWLASAAIGSSSPSGRTQQRTAPKPAGCVIGIEALSDKARVRNLTVSRAHVFYANGILTHNCDALGLVGQLLDRMQNGKSPKPAEDTTPKGVNDMTFNQLLAMQQPAAVDRRA